MVSPTPEVLRRSAHALIDTISAYPYRQDQEEELTKLLLTSINFTNDLLNDVGALRVVGGGGHVDALPLIAATSLLLNEVFTVLSGHVGVDRDTLIHDLREWADRYFVAPPVSTA